MKLHIHMGKIDLPFSLSHAIQQKRTRYYTTKHMSIVKFVNIQKKICYRFSLKIIPSSRCFKNPCLSMCLLLVHIRRPKHLRRKAISTDNPIKKKHYFFSFNVHTVYGVNEKYT